MLKIKILFIVLISLLVVSCNNSSSTSAQSSIHKTDSTKQADTTIVATIPDTITRGLVIQDYIRNKVLINHAKIANIKGNFQSFKRYLRTLNENKIESIAYAMDYVKTCIPLGDTVAEDSIFFYLRSKQMDVIGSIPPPDSMYYNVVLFAGDTNNPQSIIFNNNLSQCGIGVFCDDPGQDSYYNELSGYFYNNFKDRVSCSVKDYLSFRKTELEEGFIGDGDLTISFDALYKRVKNWENYIKKYPNSIEKEDAQLFYKEYLSVLLTGTEDSPAFDRETNILTPDFKTLFTNIMHEDTLSESTKIVSAYYKLLAQHNFIVGDGAIQNFMADNGLR